MKPTGSLVVFGWGNPSRGDDALGPELMGRLQAWMEFHPQASIATVEDFQLQIEHALDLEGHDLGLFIDASMACDAPFTFTRLSPAADDTFTTHALSPGSLLHVYRQVHRSEPPPSFLLSVRGDEFELGEPLSSSACDHLEAAWHFLENLLREPSPRAWEKHLSTAPGDDGAS